MSFKFIILIFIISIGQNYVIANDSITSKDQNTLTSVEQLQFNVVDDFWKSMSFAYKGSYMQFQRKQNLFLMGIAAGATAYFILNDERISNKAVEKNKGGKIFRVVSDSSIVANSPLFPAIFYSIAVSQNDSKMLRFSQEYLAALTLTLFETAAISMVPVHQRPDEKDLDVWEKAFRGQSSFPSGHVVGYSVLGFKAFQFYGPFVAAVPFALAAMTGIERIHNEKHYASDVIASGLISLLASEGVRYASNYDDNHPLYEWIFHHDFSINYMKYKEIPGISVSFSY